MKTIDNGIQLQQDATRIASIKGSLLLLYDFQSSIVLGVSMFSFLRIWMLQLSFHIVQAEKETDETTTHSCVSAHSLTHSTTFLLPIFTNLGADSMKFVNYENLIVQCFEFVCF